MDSSRVMVAMMCREDAKGLIREQLGLPKPKDAPRNAGRRPRTQHHHRHDSRRPGTQQQQRHDVRRPGRNSNKDREHGSQDCTPAWRDGQLVGDSLMGRVAKHILKKNPRFNQKLKAKQLGLIVHGQTVGQLLKRLQKNNCPKFMNNIFLTIGTNNILKNVPVDVTMQALQKVVDIFTSKGNVILTTLPPIPKIQGDDRKTKEFDEMNRRIMELPSNKSLMVVDVTPVFFENSVLKEDLFESDRLHFNRQGARQFLAYLEKTCSSDETSSMDEDTNSTKEGNKTVNEEPHEMDE